MGCANTQQQIPVCAAEELASQDFHDKYMLGAKIGRGAFAQVRVVTKIGAPGPLSRPGTEEIIVPKHERAVKILDLRDKEKPEELSPQLQKAAHKEATVWTNIGHHPNCIRLYDLYYGSELCYMVMEKCIAGLLQALESMPELTERGLGNVFAQMLLGISHCHSVRVVHRDIKPDNFLVGGEDGQVVKLGDFGLSAIMPKQGNKLPGVFGTAPFMCPEMLVGRWYDQKADVWSFAVIVYAFLFGLFPYMPKQQSSKAMKQAIIDGDPAPSFEPVQRAGTAPNSLIRSEQALQLVTTLLNRDPESRPSAEEALHMPWMLAAMQGAHLPGVDLPSLRPMLHAAKKVGAFEVRDPARDSTVDRLLDNIHMQRHGKPLPSTPNGAAMYGYPDRARERPKQKQEKLTRESETASNRSTACDTGSSINGGSSEQNQRLHDGSSDRGQPMQGGSGFSKGNSSAVNSEQTMTV